MPSCLWKNYSKVSSKWRENWDENFQANDEKKVDGGNSGNISLVSLSVGYDVEKEEIKDCEKSYNNKFR